jgi:hypothetical protein
MSWHDAGAGIRVDLRQTKGFAMAHWTSVRRTQDAALRLALAFGALLTVGVLDATPAAAQGAWCAEYSGKLGGTNCGFYTQQQCLWAVSGVGGFCSPSPYAYYADPRPAPRKPRRAYR